MRVAGSESDAHNVLSGKMQMGQGHAWARVVVRKDSREKVSLRLCPVAQSWWQQDGNRKAEGN